MADQPLTRYRCMRCGHTWEGSDDPNRERACPQCKSNSVRKLRKPPQ
jgi:DNA-directed RNA polymerase subunit RPC12/RpoP